MLKKWSLIRTPKRLPEDSLSREAKKEKTRVRTLKVWSTSKKLP
jgi:hypothetical protein